MYCKNCGDEISPEAKVCLKCGFANGKGHRFCSHCQTEITLGQYLCVKCGHLINEPEVQESPPKKAPAKQYEKYAAQALLAHKYRLATSILALLCLLFLAFSPIIVYEYETNLDEIESFAELEDILENDGKKEKAVSIFQYCKDFISSLTATPDEENELDEKYQDFVGELQVPEETSTEYNITVMMSMIFLIIFSILFIVPAFKNMYRSAIAIGNPSLASKELCTRLKKEKILMQAEENLLASCISLTIFWALGLIMCVIFIQKASLADIHIAWGAWVIIALLIAVGYAQAKKTSIQEKIAVEIM